MDQLKRELKDLIIVTLKLEDVTPDGIEESAPLFGDGLGLDSIDALELTVALEKRYKLSIPDEAVGKQAYASVNALAAFVQAHRQDV
jgi:acyl carrier protein